MPPELDHAKVILCDFEGSSVSDVVLSAQPDQVMDVSWEPNTTNPDELASTITLILINDTLTTPQYEADTVIHIDSIHDTVILQKDRLEIKLNRIHDTLYIKGKCKAVTVIVQRIIPVEKIKIAKADKLDNLISAIPWLVSGFIAFLALGFFLLRNRR